ncbi:MAG: hypothetical protein CVU47_05725 [Chloroflexi bacterium HGW-Chloroflexi-9]|nr:MAG: hypothetical protein CVU47_05725 [Chloroflexi bacterium HGW-Chloroflexi-9]
MELSLTIQGSPDELRRVLALLGNLDEDVAAGEVPDRQLIHFVLAASEPMVAALQIVVAASARDEAVTRADLAASAGLNSEAELNGVLGSIGRAWARRIGGTNPFLGLPGADGIVLYRIDRELAERLLLIIERRLDGTLGHGRRGRHWGTGS